MKKLNGLTFLRFVAAFYVFVFHFAIRFEPSLPTFVKNLVANGAIAMPVFFMLSGFVLAYSYAGKYRDFVSFYIARIARIYPAYLLCFLLSLPLLPFGDLMASARAVLSGLALLLVCLLLVQAWYPHFFPTWHTEVDPGIRTRL